MNQKYNEFFKNLAKLGNGCISRKDTIANGIPPVAFTRYVKSKNLVKVGPGVYANKDAIIDELFQLQKRYPKIVYSGISALYLLGLTDRIPDSIEFTIPKDYRIRKEKLNSNVICHIENKIDFFQKGNTTVKTMFNNNVCCFSKEKMIIEMIRKRDEYDSELFLKAVKTFLRKNDNDMDFLFEYAKLRNIEEKVYQVLEIMDYEN